MKEFKKILFIVFLPILILYFYFVGIFLFTINGIIGITKGIIEIIKEELNK